MWRVRSGRAVVAAGERRGDGGLRCSGPAITTVPVSTVAGIADLERAAGFNGRAGDVGGKIIMGSEVS